MSEFDISFLAIPKGHKPDWAAAERVIAELDLARANEMCDAGAMDRIEENELEDFRAQLGEALSAIRPVVDEGHRWVVCLSTNDLYVYVVDVDRTPDLFEHFDLLRHTGALQPAGFE